LSASGGHKKESSILAATLPVLRRPAPMISSNPFGNNRHADVLNEDPTDDDAKLRLVAEVKHRAKGAFGQKDMPSAELLYGKAIKLLDSIPGKSEAALYSNRAMVRLNMGKVEQALEDSNKCIELDGTFIKAYHRKAQALIRLNEWDDAIVAAKKGQEIEPSNAFFQELIDNAENAKAKDLEDKAKLKRDAQDVRVELHNASTARAPPGKKEKKVETGDNDDESDISMRGYKTRADGKKTSYFHTDISDEAKQLIEQQGYGKPHKLEGPTEAGPAEVKGGGSQWNQAGTYEERGMMKWVEDTFKQRLVGLKFDIPTGCGGSISTSAIENIKGDANISCSRGKRRHLLDLSFDVQFTATVGDASGTGKIAISEVTTVADDAPDVKIEVDGGTPAAVREVFDAFVKPAGQGLQPLLLAEIQKLVEEYKDK